MIRIGDQWLADFASCNYLGFDLDPEIIDAVPEYLTRWGTHPSWSRLLGSPAIYPEIEERLTELLGAEDTLVLPTITQIHMSVIPVLAGEGTIFLDAPRPQDDLRRLRARHGASGATLKRFPHNDVDQLERLLRQDPGAPRLICIDGVNSMTGNAPDVAAFARARARVRRAPLRRRRARLRRHRRAQRRTSLRPTAPAATASSATSARATTTSCSSAASRRRTRRCWRSSRARRR